MRRWVYIGDPNAATGCAITILVVLAAIVLTAIVATVGEAIIH